MGYVNSNWEIKINKKKTITNKRWIGQPTLFHMGIIELPEKKKKNRNGLGMYKSTHSGNNS